MEFQQKKIKQRKKLYATLLPYVFFIWASYIYLNDEISLIRCPWLSFLINTFPENQTCILTFVEIYQYLNC
jgi:hypothetical protein